MLKLIHCRKNLCMHLSLNCKRCLCYIHTLQFQVIEKLFEEFDINYNGSLDEEELAALNLKLFFDFPRIGIKDISELII